MPQLRIGTAALHYEDEGDGEPVILIHSTAMSGKQWRSLRGLLAANHRVLVPDLYGYGKSDVWPGRGPLTMAAEIEIIALMAELAGGPAHLVAHSYGGAVALHAAKERVGDFLSLSAYEPVVQSWVERIGRIPVSVREARTNEADSF